MEKTLKTQLIKNQIELIKKEIEKDLEKTKYIIREIDTKRKVRIIHLKDLIVNEYNQDMGGRELLSDEFNTLLDKRFNTTI